MAHTTFSLELPHTVSCQSLNRCGLRGIKFSLHPTVLTRGKHNLVNAVQTITLPAAPKSILLTILNCCHLTQKGYAFQPLYLVA